MYTIYIYIYIYQGVLKIYVRTDQTNSAQGRFHQIDYSLRYFGKRLGRVGHIAFYRSP